MIEKKIWEESMDYSQYRTMIDDLVGQGLTTGPIQNEDFLHYTKMNVARMNRLDKRTDILEDYQGKEYHSTLSQILVLTEAWCGDAAQVIPVVEHLLSDTGIAMRYILRDEHPEIMNQFLTNGGKAIPKFVFLDSDRNVLGSWGPRPAEVQAMVEERKAQETPEPYMEFNKKLQLWYAKDKTKSIQHEFVKALEAIG